MYLVCHRGTLPDVEKTSGVKVSCSISRKRCSWDLFLAFHEDSRHFSVGGSIGVENPCIKECLLMTIILKISCNDIKTHYLRSL